MMLRLNFASGRKTALWTIPTQTMSDPYDLRETYTRFRILVLRQANSGKTTLLQQVCNTPLYLQQEQ
jgi:hypothetical protein